MSVFQKFFGCCEKPEEQKEIYNNDQEIKTRTNSKGSPNLGTGDNSILNQSKASSNNKKAYSFIISKQNESNLKSESIIENSISSGGQLHLEDNFFPVNNNMSIEKVKTKTVTNKEKLYTITLPTITCNNEQDAKIIESTVNKFVSDLAKEILSKED